MDEMRWVTGVSLLKTGAGYRSFFSLLFLFLSTHTK